MTGALFITHNLQTGKNLGPEINLKKLDNKLKIRPDPITIMKSHSV